MGKNFKFIIKIAVIPTGFHYSMHNCQIKMGSLEKNSEQS